jgi:hypothetical protein
MAEGGDGRATLTKLDVHEPPVLGSQLLQVLVRLATKDKQVPDNGPWPGPRGQLLPALMHRRHMQHQRRHNERHHRYYYRVLP